MNNQTVTLKEAARLLDRCPSSVQKYLRDGLLKEVPHSPGIRPGRAGRRIYLDSVKDYGRVLEEKEMRKVGRFLIYLPITATEWSEELDLSVEERMAGLNFAKELKDSKRPKVWADFLTRYG